VATAAGLALGGALSALLPALTRWAVAAWFVAAGTALALTVVARRVPPVRVRRTVTGEAAILRSPASGSGRRSAGLPRAADREGRLLPPSGRPSPHVWSPWRWPGDG
jgi:acyl-coenzyme A thioesterase PaaI-like protein